MNFIKAIIIFTIVCLANVAVAAEAPNQYHVIVQNTYFRTSQLKLESYSFEGSSNYCPSPEVKASNLSGGHSGRFVYGICNTVNTIKLPGYEPSQPFAPNVTYQMLDANGSELDSATFYYWWSKEDGQCHQQIVDHHPNNLKVAFGGEVDSSTAPGVCKYTFWGMAKG